MKTIKKILFEMIPVILGILIALFINDWKQDRDNKRFLKKIYSSIDKEMEMNLKEINSTIHKHLALVDTIRYHRETDIPLVSVLEKSNGIEIPSVKNTTWNSFLNSKLELVDFNVFSTLTDVEEGKNFMSLKFEKLMEFVLKNTDSKRKRIF